MIDQEQALRIAQERVKAKGLLKRRYTLDGCTFFEERTGRHARDPTWCVRYMKPSAADGSVTDDGDVLAVVWVNAKSGRARLTMGV